jgi:hypothetical protein
MDPTAPLLSLKDKLLERKKNAERRLHHSHPHVKKLLTDHALDLDKVRHHSTRILTAGTLGGALLLGAPEGNAQGLPTTLVQPVIPTSPVLDAPPQDWLVGELRKSLPPITNAFNPPFLNSGQEKVVGKIIERATGIPAVATLEGEHLNTTYGYIGAEQHLIRYPGDTIENHGSDPGILKEGMAPGRGGFGYFTGPDGKLDPEDIKREQWYVCAQLMYLPDWNTRTRYLAQWYKWRKMIVINTENGHAVVAVMGDAGPAAWTGKHFGGSPEVMDSLGGSRYKKGRVLMYFVDDPENKVPLGPVTYDYTNLPGLKLTNLESIINNSVGKKIAAEKL